MAILRTTAKVIPVLAVLACMPVCFQIGYAGGKKPEKKALETYAAPKKMEAAATVVAPPYGYVTPLGSFDLKDGGAFHYLRGTVFDVELKATMYNEDANYYYYYENNFTSWHWAFAKNAVNGHYSVWWTQGSNTFTQFSSAVRGAR